MGNPLGPYPKYTSADQITGLIENYFKGCEPEYLKDDDGHYVMDKYGSPVMIGGHPPTITGLALALGFNSRMSLLNYQAKKEFRDVIMRAKSRVEQYTEERLFDKDGSKGAQFSLQYNFRGWGATQMDEDAREGAFVKIICDIPREAPKLVTNDVEEE